MSEYQLKTLCLVWAAVVAFGAFALARHDLIPGIEAPAGLRSYDLQAAEASKGKYTIIMFIHPQCPCSVASLEELRQLMTQYGSQLTATVVMFRSTSAADDWTGSASWSTAQQIPGVAVRADRDGTLAKRCGAQTSGQVFLYDQHGILKFDGGITGFRGHVGENNSLDLLVTLIGKEASSLSLPAHTPVFGCAIYSETVPPCLGKWKSHD